MAESKRCPVSEQFPADVPLEEDLVGVSRDGDSVCITIERPEVMNCLSFATLLRFRCVLEELRADLSIRCLLIRGAGQRAFCAGADLKERKSMPAERVPLFVRNIRALMDDVQSMPQPTVAVINGFAFGGGMELLLACDLRVAEAGAKFGLTETSLAIIPGAGGTQRLPRLVGKAVAKDLILTARRFDGEEALQLGIINRLAPEGELDACAAQLAGSITSNGPVAVRAAKRAIDEGSELPQEEGLAVESDCYALTLDTADRLEALAAFAEKRTPQFKGA